MSRAQRLRLWVRWALRDARRRWLQVTSIGLLLALGVGMYSAMSSMAGWRNASADASFAALRSHDLRVSLVAGSYVNAGRLQAALASIPDRGLVTASEERLVVPTQVDASHGRRSIIVPGRIVGMPAQPSVDQLATVRGRPLLPADKGGLVVELERNFAKHYGLPAAGSLRLAGATPVRYVGQTLAPEYFIVTAPGADFGAEANFAVLFASLQTAQRLSGERDRVNELVLRVRPGHWDACEGAGRARPLAACGAPGQRVHVHVGQPGAGPPPALQGCRGRSADDGHLRGAAARSRGVRGVQLDQSNDRGAAARNRDRHGARRQPARAGAPAAAARGSGGARGDRAGGPGWIGGERVAAIGDAVVLPAAGAQDPDADRRVHTGSGAGAGGIAAGDPDPVAAGAVGHPGRRDQCWRAGRQEQWPGVDHTRDPAAGREPCEHATAQRPTDTPPDAHDRPRDRGRGRDHALARRRNRFLQHDARRQPDRSARRRAAAPDRRPGRAPTSLCRDCASDYRQPGHRR